LSLGRWTFVFIVLIIAFSVRIVFLVISFVFFIVALLIVFPKVVFLIVFLVVVLLLGRRCGFSGRFAWLKLRAWFLRSGGGWFSFLLIFFVKLFIVLLEVVFVVLVHVHWRLLCGLQVTCNVDGTSALCRESNALFVAEDEICRDLVNAVGGSKRADGEWLPLKGDGERDGARSVGWESNLSDSQ
jgi:hypothetical protein